MLIGIGLVVCVGSGYVSDTVTDIVKLAQLRLA